MKCNEMETGIYLTVNKAGKLLKAQLNTLRSCDVGEILVKIRIGVKEARRCRKKVIGNFIWRSNGNTDE